MLYLYLAMPISRARLLFELIFHQNILFVHGILGGYEISIKVAPYQVNYGDICGGALVHEKWALTAAHCGTTENFIRVGSRHRFKGSGWGYPKEKTDYNDVLHQVRVRLVPMSWCQGVAKRWYNHTLTERMFCAGGLGKDACQGDSGGAAVSLGRIVGLSSFGFGCGRNIPGVYINLSNIDIRQWIRGYTGV